MPDSKSTGIVLVKTRKGENESSQVQEAVAGFLSGFCADNSYPIMVIDAETFAGAIPESFADWFPKNAVSSALVIDMSGTLPGERVKSAIQGKRVNSGDILFLNLSNRILNNERENKDLSAIIENAGRDIKNLLSRLAKGKELEFLPANPRREAVVIGAGISGIECALSLAGEGFSVTIIEKSNELGGVLRHIPEFYNSDVSPSKFLEEKIEAVKSQSEIKILLNSEVSAIEGEAGNMKVTLCGEAEGDEILCGAVVIAAGVNSSIAENIKERIPEDERIISLSEFCGKSGEIIEGLKSSHSGSVVLFTGNYSDSYSPVLFSSLLQNCLKVDEAQTTPVVVALSNAEVAREGTEELYTKVRNKGITIFKTSQSVPEIIKKDDRILVTVEDDYLKGDGVDDIRVVLDCALVVIEDSPQAVPSVENLAEKIRMKTGPRASMQADNLNLLTVGTNKNGIFVCGSCRQVSEISEICRDAHNVVAGVKKVLCADLKYPAEKIIVDKSKCTLCLTCVRVCPHGAIKWSRAAEISQIDCMNCGTCTSECPNRAITLSYYSDEEIYCELEGLI